MGEANRAQEAQTIGRYDEAELAELRRLAQQVRADLLKAVANAGGGHVAGPLSAADMLVALYSKVMNVRPEDPAWEDRDRFVLSKGHASIGLYCAMAARGFFPREELMTFDKSHSRLQGHPDMTKLPGLDMSTGSLGVGISAAMGMALGAKLKGKDDLRVYCMVGDGECQEGEVWEAAWSAAAYKLDNLVVLLDFNKVQHYGAPSNTPGKRYLNWGTETLPNQWRAFGWRVVEIDGHDMGAILDALYEAREQVGTGIPTCIVAHTLKGKGVSFMEDTFEWNARVPSQAELAAALKELGEE